MPSNLDDGSAEDRPGSRPDIFDTFLRLEHARATGTEYQPWTPPAGDAVACGNAFERAFVARAGYWSNPSDPIAINAIMIDLFGNAETLDYVEFSENHSRACKARRFLVTRSARTQPDPEVYRAAGAMAGDAVDHRIIAEEPAGGDGRRCFRLLDRRMAFALERRKVVRVQNLLPAESAARDRRERATARLRATLDRKARDAATPSIAHLLDALIRHDRAYAIPRAWFDGGFLPEMLVGRSLAASVQFVVQHHHTGGFDRVRLGAWQATLIEHVRRRPASPGRAVPPTLHAFQFAFPEDEQSLADLT